MFSNVWHAHKVLAPGHHLKHINQVYTQMASEKLNGEG